MFKKANTQIQLNENQAEIISINQLLSQYPNSPLKRKAMMSWGMIYFNNGEWNNAITVYKQIIADYPDSDEAKMAMSDLKSVYLEQNKVGDYAEYARSVGGDDKFQVSEQDSLTFIAAERLYLRDEKEAAINALNKYIHSFENPHFAAHANHY